jgi:hypothetical protein
VRAHRRRRTDTAGKCRQNYWKQRRKQIGRSAPTKGTIPAASSLHQLVSNMKNGEKPTRKLKEKARWKEGSTTSERDE